MRRLRDSPTETSDFCRPEFWRVRDSRLLLIRSSSLWGSGFSCRDSRSPSAFHVRNWKRMENPPVPAAAASGSDRKLLLELRKVQDTSWGGEHEKVTLPCRKEADASVSDRPGPGGRAEREPSVSSSIPGLLARLFTELVRGDKIAPPPFFTEIELEEPSNQRNGGINTRHLH